MVCLKRAYENMQCKEIEHVEKRSAKADKEKTSNMNGCLN